MSSSQRNWRCSDTDKAANYLGLMRKAGRIALGEYDAGAAARAGQRPGIDHDDVGADGADALPREDQVIVAAQQTEAVRPPAQNDRLQLAAVLVKDHIVDAAQVLPGFQLDDVLGLQIAQGHGVPPFPVFPVYSMPGK